MIANLRKLTYAEMASLVSAIAAELKRRNPIFVNFYVPDVIRAADALKEISAGEKRNFTSERGPKE